MKTLKKSLAMLLALVMSLGCMSVGAWATDEIIDDASIATAIESAASGDVIDVPAGNYQIAATIVIPAGVTIKGAGSDKTTLTITTTNGDGVKIKNPNVTISDMTIDGVNITSGEYHSLINVEADGVEVKDVIMTGGGQSTWNSSILVESLTSEQTFTVRDSTISGSFRGVLRESCSANIVIENCDITATYPFNIDGGNGGTVTVTGGALHGWTSYSSVDYVTFTNVAFSKGNSGYDCVAAYVDTTFTNCTFDEEFNAYAQTSPFTWKFLGCKKNGAPLTKDNFTSQFTDSGVWMKCTLIVDDAMYVKTGDESGEWRTIVAQIGNEYYTSLAAAVAAAKSGETVKLLKDAPLNDTLTISKAITIDGQGLYKIHPNTPSYFENKSSEQTAASSSKNLITVQSNGVTLKNLTVESRAFSRYEIGVDQGYTATLDNVVTDHTDHSSRGNDSIQLNGGLVVKNNLTVKIGASLRYYDDRGNKASDEGIVAKSWGGISFNSDNCSIHFEEGATFNGVNAYNDKLGVYGQSQAMIHLIRSSGIKDSDIAAAFAQVTGSIPSNLVKVIGNSWDMTGYEVAGSKFLTDNYAYVVTSATGTNVYYQSLHKAYAALKSGDTINADPTGKLPSDCVAIDNGNGTWTVKSAVDLAKESKETTEAGKEDAGYKATTNLTLGTAVTDETEQTTKGTVAVSAGDTIKYVAEADATSGPEDNQTTGSASEVVITSGTTETTAYVVTNAEGTTTAITSGNIGNEVTGKGEGGVLLSKENYAELFDMPAVLANLAAETNTPVTDVTITMYAAAATEDELANVETTTEHDATYEVHPVATVGVDTFEVTDPDMLKADSYNVKMYVDALYAGKNLRLTHYLANGGTEDLGVYPVKTEVVDSVTKYYVEYAMTSFSVVGINTTDSSYVLSITDTEAAYNSTDDDQTVVAGQTVTMQVKVTDAGDDSAKFIYADGTISYNDDLFELVSCTPVTDWYFLEKDSTSNTGIISFKVRASSSVYPVTSGSAIMTLVFKAKSGVSGDGAFALTNATAAKVADTEGNAITASTYGDAVTVEKTYTVVVTKANGGQATLFVEDGEDFEYTISPYNADYTYQVTATVDGNPVAADKISVDETGKITIDKSAIKGVLRVSISAFEVNVYSEYVTGYYLVTVTDRGNNGSAAYSFNGSEMYNITRTSDASKYSAYLITTDTAEGLAGSGKTFDKDVAVRYVAKAAAAAGELVIPTLDVNGTGTVDQNDYLRVFVCYERAAGTSVESRMADWLRADYDGSNKVNTVDFVQVYNAIKG